MDLWTQALRLRPEYASEVRTTAATAELPATPAACAGYANGMTAMHACLAGYLERKSFDFTFAYLM